jgi:leucyl-tRNA synthetase
MRRYNPKEIEPKWQKVWAESGIYNATEDKTRQKRYVLEYFPYPSGAAMHVGHVRNYTIGDVVARHGRMSGMNILHPMGWDGFGLPAENYAIKTGISPQEAVAQNVENFKQQLMQMGFSYDWTREVNSTDPSYYKWTQWFFLYLFKKGLAYQKESLQWWCPFDKTVLANEQVENGRCWRCGHEVEKKSLKQWFFKITEYADRLDSDLESLDWSPAIKAMQHNWIGKSAGALIKFQVSDTKHQVEVFTTRPDTIFGATFLVLAPESEILNKLSISEEHKETVLNYVRTASRKSEIERQETDREKTGVFTGLYAVNPANNENIPIWIADYVLPGYGTGAIMAVPAHDERDNEFAKKFNLPITPVIAQVFGGKLEDTRYVEGSVVVGYDKNTKKYLGLMNGDEGWLVGGGRDGVEDFASTAKRELEEESGYKEIDRLIALGDPVVSYYYNPLKKRNTKSLGNNFLAFIDSSGAGETHHEAHESFKVWWADFDELFAAIEKTNKNRGADHWLDALLKAKRVVEMIEKGEKAETGSIYTGEGALINSGKFDGLESAEARDKIIAELPEAKEKTNYKIRDWLISRQRYWGAPIPIIHCEKCGTMAVPEKDLPVVLPEVKSYEPSGDGRSPLANVPEFVNVECPECGGPAERETDTMDGFACSSWYFLRFADPHNDKAPFDKDKAEFWLPVDDYIGGAEHAVMHLLYARFWTKVMFDDGLINFDEPFKSLRNQGMILAPDGQKMSKSKGNTIEPDELISHGYGADSIRLMELFIGPWNQAVAWSVDGIGGTFRFLQRYWTLCEEFLETKDSSSQKNLEITAFTHKAIKKVTEDLARMEFNTAIAAMMSLVNELYKIKAEEPVSQSDGWRFALETLTQLLAPFAPHITEEVWESLGHEESVHIRRWPVWDEKLVTEEVITLAVQINGKVRSEIVVEAGISAQDAIAAAKADAKIAPQIEGKDIKKEIYVPGRLVSLVV